VAVAKQRQQKIQYRMGSLSAMQQLEQRTDEQLMSESRHRAAARAILGARAAERYDVKAARRFFNEAMAGAHPQERPALRQMMKASLALAERRPDDLKEAVTKLGQAPPSNRQLLLLRVMGLLAPAPGAGLWVRARGVLIILAIVFVLIAIGYGLAELVALPFGGISFLWGLPLGLLIVAAVLGVLALVGRRRQARAKEARAAARPGGSRS
jgi:hypothetical protein